MYVRRIPERAAAHPSAGRLGRHVRHDPRSLAYLYPAHKVGDLVSVRHTRHIPVLDQGDLGSCTGNAAEGAIGTGALLDAIPLANQDRPSTVNPVLDEQQAIQLYSAATALDDYDGEYPPEDTGSDGLSVAKAAQRAGLISGYTHCTSLDAALKALSQQPVIAGINWYSSFDAPDADGVIAISKSATVRGGHEICLDELDVERKRVGFTNSWGTSWGAAGRAYVSWDDFGRLLDEKGDVTVFTPVSEPAPQPAPSDPLAELAAMFRQWIASVEAWFKKHGL